MRKAKHFHKRASLEVREVPLWGTEGALTNVQEEERSICRASLVFSNGLMVHVQVGPTAPTRPRELVGARVTSKLRSAVPPLCFPKPPSGATLLD